MVDARGAVFGVLATRRRRARPRSPGRRARDGCADASAAGPPKRSVARRRPGPADRPQGPSAHVHAGRRASSSTPTGAPSRTTTLIGGPEGVVVTSTGGTSYLALRPLLSRLRPVDAARRRGRLPQGRRADRGHGRRLPRGATWSRRASGPVRSPARCCARSATTAACRPTSAATDFAEVARANVERSSARDHPAWRLTVGDLADDRPGRRGRRPGRARHAGALGLPRRDGRRAGAGRRPARLRRDDDPALADRRDLAGSTAGSPSRWRLRRWCAAGTSRGSRYAPTTA